ncbi:hypothetical protein PUNSTDRAFT_41902 [Punctularia strigosozonata HHB-11173 SS5]|uniref:uncharacterized protein n=1 Tax=Punctularia strigosozonata (strain HHB-11173) TaxID=741275 RepID=UPI000441870C|nr:uncharacterized protein PUNSTDRAFT_41902 [Punctularia strigosozonata HHB-11173 SS5]EIN12166.1 hypothetical protein PUNSTDRAFT_41902 [Punctularia strigosozonata HHB-11173 SS5]
MSQTEWFFPDGPTDSHPSQMYVSSGSNGSGPAFQSPPSYDANVNAPQVNLWDGQPQDFVLGPAASVSHVTDAQQNYYAPPSLSQAQPQMPWQAMLDPALLGAGSFVEQPYQPEGQQLYSQGILDSSYSNEGFGAVNQQQQQHPSQQHWDPLQYAQAASGSGYYTGPSTEVYATQYAQPDRAPVPTAPVPDTAYYYLGAPPEAVSQRSQAPPPIPYSTRPDTGSERVLRSHQRAAATPYDRPHQPLPPHMMPAMHPTAEVSHFSHTHHHPHPHGVPHSHPHPHVAPPRVPFSAHNGQALPRQNMLDPSFGENAPPAGPSRNTRARTRQNATRETPLCGHADALAPTAGPSRTTRFQARQNAMPYTKTRGEPKPKPKQKKKLDPPFYCKVAPGRASGHRLEAECEVTGCQKKGPYNWWEMHDHMIAVHFTRNEQGLYVCPWDPDCVGDSKTMVRHVLGPHARVGVRDGDGNIVARPDMIKRKYQRYALEQARRRRR